MKRQKRGLRGKQVDNVATCSYNYHREMTEVPDVDEANLKSDETSFVGDNTADSGVNIAYNSTSDVSTPRNSVGALHSGGLDNRLKAYKRSQDLTQMSGDSVNTIPEITNSEKRRLIRKNLTVMFSCIYAVFIVVLGGIVFINFEEPSTRYISESFSACVALMGMAWLMFFHTDLFRYKRRIMKKIIQAHEENPEDRESYSTDYNLAQWTAEDLNPPYRFITGRHSGSFYLKTGLAAFCFGHLINEGLALGQEVLNYVQEDRNQLNCGQVSAVLSHCIKPIYSFYQLFIVFKYANIVINQYRELASFALMHIMANCILFWFSAIVQDALEDYNLKLNEMWSKNYTAKAATICSTEEGMNTTNCACSSNAILSGNNLQAVPYLYPFTVEFNLLLAGVWFMVWHNIGKHHTANAHHFRPKVNNTDDGLEEITFQSNLVISADCHASNKGLFAGLFLLMTSVISVIVFFVAMSSGTYLQLGLTIHTTQETVLSLASLAGVLIAYRQLAQLDFNLNPITFLDDVLLFIPLPFYFVHSILSIAAELQGDNHIRIVVSFLVTIQVILQTPLICDGLRRCSNSQTLRYKKPGREIVTFLIVCNLTMWIVSTFEEKSVEPHHQQHHFYGEFLWMFIGHTTLPLMLFYRFHASVCLADIWKSAYEKGE